MIFEPRTRRAVLGSAAIVTPMAAAGISGSTAQAGESLSLKDWGLRGNNDPDDGARIQWALDEAPIGANLVFPPGDFRTRQPLYIRRQVNLIGAGTRLIGEFDPKCDQPLFEVNVEDPVNRDNRNQRIAGLRLALGSGLGDAIAIRNRAPNVANIGMIIEGCIISGPSGGAGHAIRLEGIGTHHLTIRNNQIINGVYVASADGVTIEECLIFGEKTGVTVDVLPGAFQTRIIRNGIVSRDGALRILNGSQVYFENNQVEQFAGYGPNASPEGAHVTIAPQAYGARHVRIRSNNFGGGGYVKSSVVVRGDCQDLLIDDNVFNVTPSGVDVVLADSAVGWTRIGPNNSARRSGVGVRKELNAGSLCVIDRGLGTFGVKQGLKTILEAKHAATDPSFRYFKTLDDVLRFEGSWGAAEGAPGAVIGRLPPGFRPAVASAVVVPTERGELAVLEISPDGSIRVLRGGAGALHWGGASLVVAPRPPYPASDP